MSGIIKLVKKKRMNMYYDSVKQWNLFVGCKFNCLYCKKSFQAQMKRQKKNCIKCYNYDPHSHEDRLTQKLPITEGDQFIWVCSSGDISFIDPDFMQKILDKLETLKDRTFLIQTKDPSWFFKFKFPDNCILGITLETNRDENYKDISNAPLPSKRYEDFKKLDFHRKSITIEPILDFDDDILFQWVSNIEPERIYIGYDTKKNSLNEPFLTKTIDFIELLENFLPDIKIKLKFMKNLFRDKNLEPFEKKIEEKSNKKRTGTLDDFI